MTRNPVGKLLLFGATGDLSQRMLLPSLYNLHADGLLPEELTITGTARSDYDDAGFRDFAAHALDTFLPDDRKDAEKIAGFLNRLQYQSLDASSTEGFPALAEKVGDVSNGLAIYLSTAPSLFESTIKGLESVGLAGETVRIGLEKPLGYDLASSKEINDAVAYGFPEERTFRIDHYLGKETVQNILVSRFSNGIFEAFWNNHYIDHVQITAAETVGVETRGNFYDQTGALRDMVPNHLFQLLAMIAMEPPAAFGADAVRGEKAKVIGAIRPWSKADALKNSVRGQYTAGQGDKPGYREEPKVDPQSTTETYVALKVMVDNWRWVGVPFYLRTGKRMSVRDTEIAICFKPAPYAQFRDTEVDRLKSNYLKIQIQPDEGMWFDLQAKRPGPAMELENVKLGFAYKDFFQMQPSTGYETLIYDCLIGDQTLFQRADNIENGWRAVQPFLDAWREGGSIATYAAGEDGPEAADELLARDGHHWHRLG